MGSVKQQVLRESSDRYGLRIVVETGTYYGDMVAAMMPQFGYPTLEEVNSLVKEWQPDLDVEVKLDSIRVTPRKS